MPMKRVMTNERTENKRIGILYGNEWQKTATFTFKVLEKVLLRNPLMWITHSAGRTRFFATRNRLDTNLASYGHLPKSTRILILSRNHV